MTYITCVVGRVINSNTNIYTWVGLTVLSRNHKRLLKPRLVGPKPSCVQDRSQILLSYDTALQIVTSLSPREHFPEALLWHPMAKTMLMTCFPHSLFSLRSEMSDSTVFMSCSVLRVSSRVCMSLSSTHWKYLTLIPISSSAREQLALHLWRFRNPQI